ncbi:MAG: LysR family transcriptional regulator [Acidiferrobacteraceae bacterium]
MSAIPAGSAASAGNMELEWSDLEVILAVCRAGSLSGAARALGQNHSTIFRKVNAIEGKTGVRFFERLPDGYKMTEAGETALRYAERVESEVHALSREVLGQDMRLQGKIRVTAPEGMAAHITPPLLAKFCKLHPEVSIEMLGGTSALDLGRREADVAIRATRKPPDASLGRKVCDFRFGMFASPRYLQQHGKQPIQEQKWAMITGTPEWLVPHIWKKKAQADRQVVFSSSITQAVLNTAAEGMGLTFLPCYLGDADPRLVRVGKPLEPLTIELWVLTHPDLRHTARVKALMAFLFDALKKDTDLFEGRQPNQGRKPVAQRKA